MLRHLPCGLLLLGAATAASAGTDIEWEESFELASELAKESGKVLFLAVNMDGERANDLMVKEVYRDKSIKELAAETVNLIASNGNHAKGTRTCPRFGTVTCLHHRSVDEHVRNQVLQADDQGYVVAPQHVFLAPDGAVILSVPYSVTIPELEWCFYTALKSVDAKFEHDLSSKARAPKRLIMGAVFDSSLEGASGARGISREEALELIKELKKGRRGRGSTQGLRKLATADEPEARQFIIQNLRSSGGRRGSNGGGSGNRPDGRAELLHWIGVASPPSYWEVAAEFIGAGERALRSEAVVALEQLAAPESLKVVRARVGKEKDERIKKNLMRAMGTIGADDKRARSALIKTSKDERGVLLQANAILALGMLAPSEDVDDVLRTTIADGSDNARAAAILAVSLTRNSEWLETLKEAQKTAQTRHVKAAIEGAIGVLDGQPLSTIAGLVRIAGNDEIERERIFGTMTRERRAPRDERGERRGGGDVDGGGEDGADRE